MCLLQQIISLAHHKHGILEIRHRANDYGNHCLASSRWIFSIGETTCLLFVCTIWHRLVLEICCNKSAISIQVKIDHYKLLNDQWFSRWVILITKHFHNLLKSFRKKSVTVTDTTIVPGICWTTDIDHFGHMNNGKYFRDLDFAR